MTQNNLQYSQTKPSFGYGCVPSQLLYIHCGDCCLKPVVIAYLFSQTELKTQNK